MNNIEKWIDSIFENTIPNEVVGIAFNLYEDETIQIYLDDQGGIACKEGDFELAPELEDMRSYIEEGRMADFHDHHYPSEMSVDAMVQTYLLDDSENALDTFLKRFDTDWQRYNRDLIRKMQDYQEKQK